MIALSRAALAREKPETEVSHVVLKTKSQAKYEDPMPRLTDRFLMALTVDDGRRRYTSSTVAPCICVLHYTVRCSTAMLRTYTPEQAAGDWTDVRPVRTPVPYSPAQFGAQLDKLAHGVSISRLISA
jgi:hypothetical protein